MSATPLFADEVEGCEGYRRCRDHQNKSDEKASFERAFEALGHLLPEGREHFASEFRRDFYSRAWELYLLAVLSNAGLHLESAPAIGPDILIHLPNGRRCWIEAVVPQPGTGEDKVFERPAGRRAVSYGSVDRLLLRYRSALEDKLKKVGRYAEAGIVAPGDHVVIAVGGWGIPDAFMWDMDVPALVKAVYPVGEPVLVVPVESEERSHVEVPPRWVVSKASGVKISTDPFLERRTAGVSGAIYVRQDVWNSLWDAKVALGFIHNDGARNPLGLGLLPCGTEWCVHGNELRQTGS
jgi:hypothetical protein